MQDLIEILESKNLGSSEDRHTYIVLIKEVHTLLVKRHNNESVEFETELAKNFLSRISQDLDGVLLPFDDHAFVMYVFDYWSEAIPEESLVRHVPLIGVAVEDTSVGFSSPESDQLSALTEAIDSVRSQLTAVASESDRLAALTEAVGRIRRQLTHMASELRGIRSRLVPTPTKTFRHFPGVTQRSMDIKEEKMIQNLIGTLDMNV